MSAVEFALGELFQDKWAREIAGNNFDASYWRDLQQRRLQSLFSWYQEVIGDAERSSWMTLKAADGAYEPPKSLLESPAGAPNLTSVSPKRGYCLLDHLIPLRCDAAI